MAMYLRLSVYGATIWMPMGFELSIQLSLYSLERFVEGKVTLSFVFIDNSKNKQIGKSETVKEIV